MRIFNTVVVSLFFTSLAAAGPLPQNRSGRQQSFSLRVAVSYSHTAAPILPRDDTLNTPGAAALDPNPTENALAKEPTFATIPDQPVDTPDADPAAGDGDGGEDSKDSANGPQEPPETQPATGANPDLSRPATGPSLDLRQPATGTNSSLHQPATGANPDLSQPATGPNPDLSQPVTDGNPDLSHPVTGAGGNDEMEPTTGSTQGVPTSQPVTGPGGDVPVNGPDEKLGDPATGANPDSSQPATGIGQDLTPGTGANPDLSNNDPATSANPDASAPVTGANPELTDGNNKHSNNATEAVTGPANSSERLPKSEVDDVPARADAIITPSSALRTINTDPTAATSYVAPVSVLSSLDDSGLEVSVTGTEDSSSTATSSAKTSDSTTSADLSIETSATIMETSIETSPESSTSTLSTSPSNLTSEVASATEAFGTSTSQPSESNAETTVPSETFLFAENTPIASLQAPTSSVSTTEEVVETEVPATTAASSETPVASTFSSSSNIYSRLTTTVIDGTTFVGRLTPSSASILPAMTLPSSTSIVNETPSFFSLATDPVIQLPTIISSDPTPTSISPQIYASNLANAEQYNTSFLSLDSSSPCRPGSIACVNGKTATCSSSSTFSINDCRAGEQCFALPIPNADGVYVGCYDIAKADEMLKLPSSGEVTIGSVLVVVESTTSWEVEEVQEETSTIYQTLESTIYVTVPAASAVPTPETKPQVEPQHGPEQPAADPAPVSQPQAESQAPEPTAAAEPSGIEPVVVPTPAPTPSPEPRAETALAVTTVQNNVEQNNNEQLPTVTVTQIVTETQVLERTKTKTATETKTEVVTVTSAPPGFNLGFGQ